jgi:Protein of unknown function (DUF3631)
VLSDEAEEDAADGMWLLADLRDVFGAEDKLWTETILAALHGIPEVPWDRWLEHPLRDRELAKLLKPYGIRSRDVKIDGVTTRARTTSSSSSRDEATWARPALPALPRSD